MFVHLNLRIDVEEIVWRDKVSFTEKWHILML